MRLVFPAEIPQRIMDETRIVITVERVIARFEDHPVRLLLLSFLNLYGNHFPQALIQFAIYFFNDRQGRRYRIVDQQETTILFQTIDVCLKFEHDFWLFGMSNGEREFPFTV